MTLRESLGGGGQSNYEKIDALLDSEDGLLVLFDGARMVSYTQGFGVSPCQLELLSVELERAVRNVVAGQPTTSTKDRRNREETNEADGRGRGAVLGQHLGRHGRGDHRSVVNGSGRSAGSGDAAHCDNSGAGGRVLRLASKTA